MNVDPQTWLYFNGLIVALLALDLGVFNRSAHVIKLKEAFLWSLFWIALGVTFGAWIWNHYGAAYGVQYLTGYVVEKSLSVDNLFVFVVIFRAFNIEKKFQHRLLFWGVLGAICLRGVMIAAGSHLLERFHALIYVFGAFLIYTGLSLFKQDSIDLDPLNTPVMKGLRRLLPFSTRAYSDRFTVLENGRRVFTTAFAALVVIETSDVLFALDSVPAVFGVTRESFLVYSSNIFAILGLRSLYFVLEDFMDRFHMLKYGLATVLTLVGVKMIAEHWIHISSGLSLIVIGGILLASIAASFMITPQKDGDA